jgi:hypothetical protein
VPVAASFEVLAMSIVYNAVFGGSEASWNAVVSHNMSDKAAYIAALYWAGMTLTTIGYGDITPETQAQRVFVTCVMLVGVFLYGYIIGAVSALLSSAGERRHQFLNTKKLNDSMDNRFIPADLRFKLREDFRFAAFFCDGTSLTGNCFFTIPGSLCTGLDQWHTCALVL